MGFSVKRVLLTLIVVFAVIGTAGSGLVIWGSWVTPFERSALRNALDRSERLETCTSDVGSDYERLVSEADKAMGKAERHAFSLYDHQLLAVGKTQLRSAKAICTLRRKAVTDPEYAKSLQVIESVQGDGYKMLRSHL